MADEKDDNFDRLLREHLADQLDPQLGRAMPVLKHLARGRWPVFAGAALAAAIGALFMLRPLPKQPETSSVANAIPSDVQYELAWQTVDQGTVFLDPDTPVKAYMQQAVETTSWIDPNTHTPMKMTVPKQEILLIGMDTF